MTKRGGNTRKRRRFNWLKNLDRRAASSGMEVFWRQKFSDEWCPLFIMTRYPTFIRLISEEALNQIWAEERDRLQSSKCNRVLGGLSDRQKSELFSLVHDVRAASVYYQWHRNSEKSELKSTRQAPIIIRRLDLKAQAIRAKLQEFYALASAVPFVLGREYKISAEKCLKILEHPTTPAVMAEWSGSTQRDFHSDLDRPSALGVVQLFWFFNYECGLSGRESQVRVAIIANEILGQSFDYQLSSKDGPGSQAVRRTVDRFSPRTKV
jgi:hypothetical protein